MRVLKSEIDPSVNFVWDLEEGQALEARYVRRSDDYFACYLSCQTACAQACRMCHLTATGQNKPRDASWDEILEQARTVLDHYMSLPGTKLDRQLPHKTVHYNFMARGEPFACDTVLHDSEDILIHLGAMAKECGLLPRYLFSTIMPENLDLPLAHHFPTVHPEIYYSLYSMDSEFRRRWLPRAMDPRRALDMLKDWQQHTKKIVKIHFALIEGVNDTRENALEIASEVNKRELKVSYALVRYNPPAEKHGQESSGEGTKQFALCLRSNTPGSTLKMVDRVGFDVAASCGMFV